MNYVGMMKYYHGYIMNAVNYSWLTDTTISFVIHILGLNVETYQMEINLHDQTKPMLLAAREITYTMCVFHFKVQ